MKYLLLYFVIISFIGVLLTVADKIKAKRGSMRISENALLCVSALGGSVFVLVCMLLIRHKTKKVKFMVGIPLIIILQLLFCFFVWNFIRTNGIVLDVPF